MLLVIGYLAVKAQVRLGLYKFVSNLSHLEETFERGNIWIESYLRSWVFKNWESSVQNKLILNYSESCLQVLNTITEVLSPSNNILFISLKVIY